MHAINTHRCDEHVIKGMARHLRLQVRISPILIPDFPVELTKTIGTISR